MKTRYKYIHFVESDPPDTKPMYECQTNRTNAVLGGVWWYKDWKQWTFVPEGSSIFSSDCLEDIQDFIRQLAYREDSDPHSYKAELEDHLILDEGGYE